MSYFWKMSQCNIPFTWKNNLSHSDIFHGPVMFLRLFFALKNILVLMAKRDSGELRCPRIALFFFTGMESGIWIIHFCIFLYGIVTYYKSIPVPACQEIRELVKLLFAVLIRSAGCMSEFCYLTNSGIMSLNPSLATRLLRRWIKLTAILSLLLIKVRQRKYAPSSIGNHLEV